MGRYLRPLAIAVVIVEVCVAAFTIPVLYVNLFYFFFGFQALVANGLITQALIITGTALTFALGVLTAVLAAQRGHRPWSIAFVILLVLFAYSPLLLAWVLQSQTYLYDAARFNVNTPAYTFVELWNHILPAIILAVVVFVYSLRHERKHAHSQDAELRIERSRIDGRG